MDTYGCGCMHNCSYCYARSLLDFRGLWNAENPRVADIQKIRRKLEKVPQGTMLRLGGMTDCFQPMESQEQITYQTIEQLQEIFEEFTLDFNNMRKIQNRILRKEIKQEFYKRVINKEDFLKESGL